MTRALRKTPHIADDTARLLIERVEELIDVMQPVIKRHDEFILLPEVQRRTQMKKSAIYARIKAKTFPAPCKDGGVNWFVEREVQGWIEQRIRERDEDKTSGSGR